MFNVNKAKTHNLYSPEKREKTTGRNKHSAQCDRPSAVMSSALQPQTPADSSPLQPLISLTLPIFLSHTVYQDSFCDFRLTLNRRRPGM